MPLEPAAVCAPYATSRHNRHAGSDTPPACRPDHTLSLTLPWTPQSAAYPGVSALARLPGRAQIAQAFFSDHQLDFSRGHKKGSRLWPFKRRQ